MTIEPQARTHLVTALLLLLVLSSGFALGVAVDRRLAAPGTAEGGEVSAAATGEEGGRRDSEARARGDSTSRGRSLLVERVGLSGAQKAQVDSIVGFYRHEMRSLHVEFDQAYNSRYREILGETREDIRAVLTEQQRMDYDSILAEADNRREQRRRDSTSSSGNPRGGQRGGR